MEPSTLSFLLRASRVVAEASTDLGALIAAPGDAASADALRAKLLEVRDGAVTADLPDIGRLAGEAMTPLEDALARARRLDRRGLQTAGWAVQALGRALAAATAAPAPVAAAA